MAGAGTLGTTLTSSQSMEESGWAENYQGGQWLSGQQPPG